MKKSITTLLVMSIIAGALFCGCVDRSISGQTANFTFELIETGEATYQANVAGDNITEFKVKTSQTTVGAALLELGLIEGEVHGGLGLMVQVVDGLRADFDDGGAYWSFYIDGEQAMSGADATAIEEGKVYAFVYTKA